MKTGFALLIIAIAPVFASDRVPGFFFGNESQTDSEKSFNMETPGLKATFRNEAVVYRIHGLETELRFTGANPRVKIEPAEPMTGKLNILVGKDARAWKTNVTIYQKLIYKDLYPGIDLSYSGSGGQAKADFLVKPHADPAQIRLSYPRAQRVWIDSNGDLVISDAAGELRERAPVVYQKRASERIEIQGRYRLVDEHTAEFEIGDYDRARTLVIDPVVSYSTFFGGGMTGAVTGVATDGTGSVYVTGWTESIDFPIAGAAVAIELDGDTVARCRIVLSADASYPLEVTAAEDFLKGKRVSTEAIRETAEIAAKPAKPLDNADLSHFWRKRMVRVVVEQALQQATIRTGGSTVKLLGRYPD